MYFLVAKQHKGYDLDLNAIQGDLAHYQPISILLDFTSEYSYDSQKKMKYLRLQNQTIKRMHTPGNLTDSKVLIALLALKIEAN